MTVVQLKAPFPYFGGKSRAASLIWQRFGDVPNYVEPFAGSLAVLLARPTAPRIETINDLDAHVANFWRALQGDPEQVAHYADWPINEVDLHARHRWLIARRESITELLTDPDAYDAKVAGWWVWGISAWIGSGWCSGAESSQIPHLGNVAVYLAALSERLRRVRVACGDWSRICGDSVTFRHGLTAVLLDPPYAHAERAAALYADDSDISADVRAWAIVNGDNPKLRIALCGYDGEHAMPDSWAALPWKARGGYGSQGTGRGRANSNREMIWFSPHCLQVNNLFSLEMAL